MDDARHTSPHNASHATDRPGADVPSDPQLVERVARGDHAALGQLIERHQQRVFSLSYRVLGRWDQAEEAAQEVFIKVYRSAGKYRPEALFTTWLYRIVVNHCLDMKRKAARMPVAVSQEQLDRMGELPEDRLEARERSERVRQAVNELPEAQQTALLLHRFEGQPIRQIAEVMERSESAVESLLVRAYVKLRETLSDLKNG